MDPDKSNVGAGTKTEAVWANSGFPRLSGKYWQLMSPELQECVQLHLNPACARPNEFTFPLVGGVSQALLWERERDVCPF